MDFGLLASDLLLCGSCFDSGWLCLVGYFTVEVAGCRTNFAGFLYLVAYVWFAVWVVDLRGGLCLLVAAFRLGLLLVCVFGFGALILVW